MKEKLVLTNYEKQLLNQRNLIETVFDCLKHKYHVWHTRHRSVETKGGLVFPSKNNQPFNHVKRSWGIFIKKS